MKYGYAVKKNGVLYAPGMDVPGDKPEKVVLVDDVPNGALEANADGSVNTYDEAGNIVGTLSEAEMKELQEEASAAFEAQDKTKRGRKAKEE